MQEVLRHVERVHNPLTTQEVRSASDRFLYETFFRSDDCWEILIQILQNQDLPSELHFFGAQFLRTKMAKNFRQLQQDQLSQLQNLLLDLIKPFTNNQIILKQMSLAVADFSVQRPEWGTVVKDFVKNLYPNHTLALLNILLCLPEEIHSGRIPLAPPQKRQIQDVYRICAPDVLSLLENMWQRLPEKDNDNRRLVLECFASWSRVFNNIDASNLLNSKLFECVFQAVGLQDTFTHACSALLELIRIACRQDDGNWGQIRNIIINGVLKQQNILERAISNDDADSTYHIARLFVMTCLDFKADLCKRPNDLKQMLTIVIAITRQPALKVSQQAFRFWTSLMEDRYENEYQATPNPTSALQELFEGAAQEGLKAVIDAIRYPKEYNNFDEEQKEEWHDHRSYGTDVINDLCRYLNIQPFIHVVIQKLKVPLEQWPKCQWEEIEACFHALNQTVGGQKDTAAMFKEIVDVALQMTEPTQLRETITWLLSSYADLPTKLPPEAAGQLCAEMLKYSIGGLYTKERRLRNIGAETFKNICRYSPEVAKQHLDGLLDQYETGIITAEAKMESSDICEYVWGICEIFRVMPINNVKQAMSRLMAKPLQYLEAGLQANNPAQAHHALKILSEIFRRTRLIDNIIEDKHPVVEALEKIWKYLGPVMQRYNTNNDIMEKTTRIIKSAIRNASVHYVQSELAQLILQQVVEVYKSSSKSCFLYLISVYVDCYGKMEQTQQLFDNCLVEIIQKTNSLLPNLSEFTNDPDLVEDFYELLIRYFKRCPQILLKKDYLDCFMDMSLRGFRIQHYEASKAILLFIQTLIRQGTDKSNSREREAGTHSKKNQTIAISPQTVNLINSVLQAYGERLITELVYAVTTLNYKRLDDHCHIMEAWFQFNPQLLQQALAGIIEKLPLDPVFPTKREFLQTYFNSRQNGDRHRYDALREFSEACDRYRQTQTYHK